ncbi:MAG TPA: heme exporter protein CcmD [Gammaproteobacteria bacterium]|nr:heme exporter protein CcmD [Gammaproteobacteria bacterium]
MRSLHEFLTMGGYALYVWPAYAAAFVVMAGSAWLALRGLRRARERAIRHLEDEA